MAGRARKILDRFPAFMRSDQPGKAMGDVVAALGAQLDEAERVSNRIQRAHRIAVAEEERDVLALAALAGLERADFFILRKFYENGYFVLAEKDVAVSFTGGKTGFDFVLKITALEAPADIQAEIQAKMNALLAPTRTVIAVREIVGQVARSQLYRLRGAALVAARGGDNATFSTATVAIADPADPEDREQRAYAAYLDHLRDSVQRVAEILLDGCGTIHALLEGTSVLLNADTTGPVEHTDAGLPRGGFVHRLPVTYTVLEAGQPVEHTGFVYMIENPIVDKNSAELDRSQHDSFRVKRGGFFPGPVAVKITGKADRTVWPRVVNETTHEGVGLRQAIGDGQVLLFSLDGQAFVDGAGATTSAYYFEGGLFDLPKTDSSAPRDVHPVATPPGSLDRGYPRPAIAPAASLPAITLPLGESDWRFSVETGVFDASGFDESVFDGPTRRPPAKVQLLWKEEKPFACTILIPADLQVLEKEVLDGEDLRKLVRAGLERFRTAGIVVDVDYFDSRWIVGKSVLENIDAKSGVGVDLEATVPWDTPAPE